MYTVACGPGVRLHQTSILPDISEALNPDPSWPILTPLPFWVWDSSRLLHSASSHRWALVGPKKPRSETEAPPMTPKMVLAARWRVDHVRGPVQQTDNPQGVHEWSVNFLEDHQGQGHNILGGHGGGGCQWSEDDLKKWHRKSREQSGHTYLMSLIDTVLLLAGHSSGFYATMWIEIVFPLAD